MLLYLQQNKSGFATRLETLFIKQRKIGQTLMWAEQYCNNDDSLTIRPANGSNVKKNEKTVNLKFGLKLEG